MDPSLTEFCRKKLRSGTIKSQNRSDRTPPHEDTYEYLFNLYPDPICILDKEGNILSWNQAASLFFHENPERIENILKKQKPQQNMNETLTYFEMAFTGEIQEYHSVSQDSHGNMIETHTKIIPIKDNGNIAGIVIMLKDVTERNQQVSKINKLEQSVNLAQKLANIGIWEYEPDNDKAFWSEKMYEIYGLSPGEKVDFHTVCSLVHPEDLEKYKKEYYEAKSSRRNYHIQYRIIRRDGTIRHIMASGEMIHHADDQPVRYVGTNYDITEQQNLQEMLEDKEKQLLEIADNLEAAIWSKDVMSNRILFTSKGIEEITGYPSTEFEEGRLSWEDLIYKDDLFSYKSRQKNLSAGRVPMSHYRIIDKSCEIVWVQDTTISVFDHGGNLVRLDGVITDITEQKKSEERMAFIAYHDHLTGLPNRRLFEEELTALIEKSALLGTEFALIYLDMDGFKKINDTLGHPIGDKLLVKISNRLKQCITSHDLIARMGGDEFTILVRHMKSIDHPVSIAKKIISSLEQAFYIGDFELYITASIGITSYPADGEDAETLMKKADTALFRAKETGKNAYQIYNSTMNIEAFKLYSLERGLRKAIKKRELSFHYQPKVNTMSGRITGAEALIRWNHPEWGMVSPGEFIPLAEETDLIFKITDYTFHTVCRQINEWEAQKLPVVPISINISPKLFLRTDWLDNILKIIEETGVNPKWLELEIVETALIHNEEAFLSAVQTLKKMGVKISLDDFGTGFSSLLYLKKFNFDTVKIDRSFIKDFLLDSDSMITKSIIYLAHGLKMDVVAEGVETRDQLEFLRQQGCDQIQGYLFSKPLPAEDFIKILMEPVLKPANNQSRQTAVNRRKVSRFDLPVPLSADMTINKMNGIDFTLGKTEVLIENIGFGGLRLLTHLKLPVNPEILYEFETDILGHTFKVLGRIVWKQETNDDFFQYGAEYIMNGQDMNRITDILNELQLQTRKDLLSPGGRFIKEDSIRYLKKQISK